VTTLRAAADRAARTLEDVIGAGAARSPGSGGGWGGGHGTGVGNDNGFRARQLWQSRRRRTQVDG